MFTILQVCNRVFEQSLKTLGLNSNPYNFLEKSRLFIESWWAHNKPILFEITLLQLRHDRNGILVQEF